MLFLFLGVLGFVLLFLYDINQVHIKNKVLSYLFFIGTILIFFATFGALFYDNDFLFALYLRVSLLSASFVFFLIMIYALFFALPFEKTYKDQKEFILHTKGLYSICRHPAIIPFILFYLFLWLGTGIRIVLFEFLVFSVLNIAYSMFQDKFIFPKLFKGYESYKKVTPFILPRLKLSKR